MLRHSPAWIAPIACVVLLNTRLSQAAPAGCSDLTYGGGPVISNVEVVEVYWTAQVAQGVKDALPQFYTTIVNSAYLDWLFEYDTAGKTPGSNQYIGRGTFQGAYTITPSVTTTSLTDAQVGAELISQIRGGHLPTPKFDAAGNVNTYYSIDFPPGVSITMQNGGGTSCQEFCAYHNSVAWTNGILPFGVLPDLTTGACSGTACGPGNAIQNTTYWHSHELLEAITDTEASATSSNAMGWYANSSTISCAGEIGDICYFSATSTATVQGYMVAMGWSNRMQQCIAQSATVPPPCTAPNVPTGCRGCTQSDNGTNCTGSTPHCDTLPTSPNFGRCVVEPADAGSAILDSGVSHLDSGVEHPDSGAHVTGCVPGEQVACACVGGTQGAQICEPSGAGFEPCQCPDGGNSTVPAAKSSGGCGCRVGTHSNTGLPLLIVAGALGAIFVRGRTVRRSRQRSTR